MVGKKSGKALLREEGLARTDNNMDLTSWPQASMINQKNYYTEYLKRDDQILALRLSNEEARNQMTKKARDRDRALALSKVGDEDTEIADEDTEDAQDAMGTKTIVIHIGSQNLRVGFASDVLPKAVPMVIARKWKESESEKDGGQPRPRRLKAEDGSELTPEKAFGEEWSREYLSMCAELKQAMRNHKRRLLPNSKELVVNYNRKVDPEIISEHNDPLRIEWTEVASNGKEAPNYICGKEALRIPDDSYPRYKLFWPIRHGWYNENDYDSKMLMLQDVYTIIKEAFASQLGLTKRSELAQYGCVFVIPDLYEKIYVCNSLDMLMKDFGFGKCCFIQESLAATFGAGYTQACIVDIGAQKTSICCVEDGMCIENSRLNLKMGGADVTEAFIRMMLYDHFPYAEINLNRRYDSLLAEELKLKCCTLNEASVSVQLFDFHLRAPGKDTRKYTFKTYDEPNLAVIGLFDNPNTIFNHEGKLTDRRKLIDRSYDLYDNSPNDPVSMAQIAVIKANTPGELASADLMPDPATAPLINKAHHHLAPPQTETSTPRSTTPLTSGSPIPDGTEANTPAITTDVLPTPSSMPEIDADKTVLATSPLPSAILNSISYAARLDDRRTREFLGGIMVVGGGSLIPNLPSYLEERLGAARPQLARDIMVGIPPRELDPQVVVWKGAGVFGKLMQTNDSWISPLEFDRLGSRILAYKLMFQW